MKNHSRSFGGNKRGPGFRTSSAFRGQVSLKRQDKMPINFKNKFPK